MRLEPIPAVLCETGGCPLPATVRLLDGAAVLGHYCERHGRGALLDVEGERESREAVVAAVRAAACPDALRAVTTHALCPIVWPVEDVVDAVRHALDVGFDGSIPGYPLRVTTRPGRAVYFAVPVPVRDDDLRPPSPQVT